jgi:redox-sensitive bicupin YhaK (pirin superfamily)
MGPILISDQHGMDIGPHPHMGLQTVTWLLEGRALHRDSLGSEQEIAAGQLNLMTAGHGVSHSEETAGVYEGPLEGIQLWIAQPEATRDGAPRFEHLPHLPVVELEAGLATVLVGSFAGLESPARHDTALIGVDLALERSASIALEPSFEHALIVLRGGVELEGRSLAPGQLAYLAPGRSALQIDVTQHGRIMLLGGLPLGEELVMWWNFVARSRDEVREAYRSWMSDDGRFGSVASLLPRIEVAAPAWERG